MLGDLAVAFPEVREGSTASDATLGAGREPIGPLIFPPSAFDERSASSGGRALAARGRPAGIGAACLGLLRLLGVARASSRIWSPATATANSSRSTPPGRSRPRRLAELSEARGRFLREAAGDEPGAMAAVCGGPDRDRARSSRARPGRAGQLERAERRR